MKTTNSKRIIIPILLATFITILAFGTVYVAAQSNHEAYDTIRVFMNDPNLELIKVQDMSIDQDCKDCTYSTVDGTSIFSLNSDMKNVLIAVLADELSPRNMEVNHDQALMIGQNFVNKRVNDFNNMTLVQDKIEDHGAAGKTFRFLWAELLGSQDAMGLKRVAVTVDVGSGSVLSFMQIIPEALSIEVEPLISYQQAIEIAKADFGEKTISEEAGLDVWWFNNDHTQPQFLRWTVTLESGIPLELINGTNQSILSQTVYIIDAQNGKIIEELH